jgi:hypothetical protein
MLRTTAAQRSRRYTFFTTLTLGELAVSGAVVTTLGATGTTGTFTVPPLTVATSALGTGSTSSSPTPVTGVIASTYATTTLSSASSSTINTRQSLSANVFQPAGGAPSAFVVSSPLLVVLVAACLGAVFVL